MKHILLCFIIIFASCTFDPIKTSQTIEELTQGDIVGKGINDNVFDGDQTYYLNGVQQDTPEIDDGSGGTLPWWYASLHQSRMIVFSIIYRSSSPFLTLTSVSITLIYELDKLYPISAVSFSGLARGDDDRGSTTTFLYSEEGEFYTQIGSTGAIGDGTTSGTYTQSINKWVKYIKVCSHIVGLTSSSSGYVRYFPNIDIYTDNVSDYISIKGNDTIMLARHDAGYGTSKLRVKDNSETVSLVLVDTDHYMASPVRVCVDGSGTVKSIARYSK